MENLDTTTWYIRFRWVHERLDPFLPSPKIGTRQKKYGSGWSIAVQFLNEIKYAFEILKYVRVWLRSSHNTRRHPSVCYSNSFCFRWKLLRRALVELYVRWHKLWKEWHRRKMKREICLVFYLLSSVSCCIFILHLMKQNYNWSVFIFHLSSIFPFPLRPMVSMASMASYPLVRMMRARIVCYFLRSLCEQKVFRSASVRCPLINSRSESLYFRKKGRKSERYIWDEEIVPATHTSHSVQFIWICDVHTKVTTNERDGRVDGVYWKRRRADKWKQINSTTLM